MIGLTIGELSAICQQPELVGTLHECREHDLVRYVMCVEDSAVFDLAPTNGKKKVVYQDTADPRNHVNWFQHDRFEGYVVKPEGEEPQERPDDAVKEKRIIQG